MFHQYVESVMQGSVPWHFLGNRRRAPFSENIEVDDTTNAPVDSAKRVTKMDTCHLCSRVYDFSGTS